ncbi:hypothetical protein P3T73_10955 [Kiritimatiellota bacterium B12222]|nr:hypothetical protein P3T73_10955 [Kiritimatiellota bacterium B12222]
MIASPQYLGWLLGSAGYWIAFAWGFGEATVFFILPDLLLSLTALFAFRKAWKQLGWMIVGSILGGVCIYLWTLEAPRMARQVVDAVPFVTEEMWIKVQLTLSQHGGAGLVLGPFSGIPYKVYAVESAERVPLLWFVLFSFPARLSRLVGAVLLFGGVGALFKQKIIVHPGITLAMWGLYWIGMYSWYWGSLLGGTT